MDTEADKVVRDDSEDSVNTRDDVGDTLENNNSEENMTDMTPKMCTETDVEKSVSIQSYTELLL